MGVSYLIDTHILLWWAFDKANLETSSRKLIANQNNTIIVSSASAWEIATKYRLGKLPKAKNLVENYSETIERARFVELPVTTAHALRAGSLPIAHRDPFDRMLMAQAELEGLPVITKDKAFHTGLIQVIPQPKTKQKPDNNQEDSQ